MKEKQQVYQDPEMKIQYLTREDVITSSNLNWEWGEDWEEGWEDWEN